MNEYEALDVTLKFLNEKDERKGYPVEGGYMGYNPETGQYDHFDTEGEYNEWYRDHFGED